MKIACELLGTTFELPAAPRRIVSLVSAATETVAQLGGLDRLVGVSPYCARYVPDLAAPVVGDYVRADIEALRALAPDLLLFTGGVQLPLARRCAAAGLPAYACPVPASRFGILENIVTVGALIGRVDAARALVDRDGRRLRVAPGAPAGRRGRASTWNSGSAATRAPPAGATFVHDLVELSGGQNIFGSSPQGYLPLDIPAVAAARPDVGALLQRAGVPRRPRAAARAARLGRAPAGRA